MTLVWIRNYLLSLFLDLIIELQLLNLKQLLFIVVANFKSQFEVARARRLGSVAHAHREVEWLTSDQRLQVDQRTSGGSRHNHVGRREGRDKEC